MFKINRQHWSSTLLHRFPHSQHLMPSPQPAFPVPPPSSGLQHWADLKLAPGPSCSSRRSSGFCSAPSAWRGCDRSPSLKQIWSRGCSSWRHLQTAPLPGPGAPLKNQTSDMLRRFYALVLVNSQFNMVLDSPGGSTNSLELLSPVVKSYWKKQKQTIFRSPGATFYQQPKSKMLLSANLLKQSRESSLYLVNKVLSFLLKQIFTPEQEIL